MPHDQEEASSGFAKHTQAHMQHTHTHTSTQTHTRVRAHTHTHTTATPKEKKPPAKKAKKENKDGSGKNFSKVSSRLHLLCKIIKNLHFKNAVDSLYAHL